MKVNEWINQKFWQSIFIPLAASIEHAARIRIQHKLCLRRATTLVTLVALKRLPLGDDSL